MTKTLTLTLSSHPSMNCNNITVSYTDVECVNAPTSTQFTIPVKNYDINDADYAQAIDKANQFISTLNPNMIPLVLNVYAKAHEYIRHNILYPVVPRKEYSSLIEPVDDLTSAKGFVEKMLSYNEYWRSPEDKNKYSLGSDLVAISLYTKLLIPVTGALNYRGFNKDKPEEECSFALLYDIEKLFAGIIERSPFDRMFNLLQHRTGSMVHTYFQLHTYAVWNGLQSKLLTVYLPQFDAEEIKKDGRNPDEEILLYVHHSLEKEAQKIKRFLSV